MIARRMAAVYVMLALALLVMSLTLAETTIWLAIILWAVAIVLLLAAMRADYIADRRRGAHRG